MFEFGTLAVDGNRLPEAAFPHLQALASRTGLAAQLAILDHAEVVYLERIVVGPIRLPTRRGGRKPAYCTALGKAMAAYDDDAIATMMAAPMPRKTPQTITEPIVLRTELNRVREAGVAYDRGEAYEELVCVAAPIRTSGQAIAAVSVTGLAGRMQWSVMTEAVRSTAAAIWNANLNLRAGRRS
jgi:DNA-binding IclR family transcriptional regulator